MPTVESALTNNDHDQRSRINEQPTRTTTTTTPTAAATTTATTTTTTTATKTPSPRGGRFVSEVGAQWPSRSPLGGLGVPRSGSLDHSKGGPSQGRLVKLRSSWVSHWVWGTPVHSDTGPKFLVQGKGSHATKAASLRSSTWCAALPLLARSLLARSRSERRSGPGVEWHCPRSSR